MGARMRTVPLHNAFVGCLFGLVLVLGAASENEVGAQDQHATGSDVPDGCASMVDRRWSPDVGDTVAGPDAAVAGVMRELFDAEPSVGVAENFSIESGILRVRYPAGSINPSHPTAPVGGGLFYSRIPDLGDHACLSYSLRFDEGFQFALGGKLPGLFSRTAPSGGRPADGLNGFSVRLAWRSEGAGEVYAYVGGTEPSPYGESWCRGCFTLIPGRWMRVDLEIRLNQPNSDDGIARLWVDGVLVVEQTGIHYRADPSMVIDGMMFSTFFGGQSAAYASPIDQSAYFRDFVVSTP